MKLRTNANTVIGLVLLVVGAVALVAGMGTPANSAGSRIVIRDDDGEVHRIELDDRDWEEFGAEMERFGEQMSTLLEDLDIDLDLDFAFDDDMGSRVRVYRNGRESADIDFDADQFAEHMERWAEKFSRRMERMDDHDVRRIERHAERMAAQVERQVEQALRHAERARDRGRIDRDDDGRIDRLDDADAIRDEIRDLERQLRRLERELERMEDEGGR